MMAPDPTSTASAPRRTAVVDLGSNTFRLVVFEQVAGGGHRLVDEFRETVRLSAGSGSGRLSDEAIERAALTAAAYARFCRAAGIEDIVAIATSAIREADNGDDALEAIRAGGLRAKVVDSREEARLGYLGAVNSTTLVDGHVLDIGGGSAQVVRVQGRRMVASLSEPLGAVRMTEEFFPDGRIGNGRRAKLVDFVHSALKKHDWIDSSDRLVGLGGSLRTLASMAGRRSGDPLRMVHGSHLTMDHLDALIEDMAAVEPDKRARIAGLKSDRADILPAAAIVLKTILEVLEVAELDICGHGLREGAFWAHLYPDEPLLEGVRRHWVENLAILHGADRAHAERVARLAAQIYEGTAAAGLQEPHDQERSLLWAAAQLHDIGTSIDYHDHHKHSQYLVMNAGLPGHDPRELTLIGRLVRGHRKRLPSASDGDHHMRSGDAEMVLRLLVCLRIAEQLERDRAGTIHAVDVTKKKKDLVLKVHTSGDASLAIWAAERETEIVQKVFGCGLRLKAAG